MTQKTDILLCGTGLFAGRLLFDIAATAKDPVHVTIVGRNAERLGWLSTAARGRAAIFGTPARFSTLQARLSEQADADHVMRQCAPSVILQTASVQTSAVIAQSGNAWSDLVTEGGLSATAIFQALITSRVARAARAGSQFINCCFPDVVNGMLRAAGLRVACGTGNVSILSSAFAGVEGVDEGTHLKVLAHYQTLSNWRRPAEQRDGVAPRVWLDGREIKQVLDHYAQVLLTPEPAIELSGAAGVPLALAMAAGKPWRGHAPGPLGLPGGYPVAWDGAELRLDLPEGLTEADAIAWNTRFEQAKGLVVDPSGQVRFTGVLESRLRTYSPELAKGFAIGDLDYAYSAWSQLRNELLNRPGQ